MLNSNKIKHIMQVAQEARCHMDKILPKNDPDREAKLDAAFIMGLLHDIGYDKLEENDTDPARHAGISMAMAKHFVTYAKETLEAIANHGHDDCSSPFAYALNKADLTVGSHGEWLDMEERVRRIEEHYPNTEHARHARQQYDYVIAAEKRLMDQKKDADRPRTYKAVDFDTFARTCPWEFCHNEGTVNNGSNCSHPRQEIVEDDDEYTGIGRCHCFSCPLGIMAEESDIKQDPDDCDAIKGEIDWTGIGCGADEKPLPGALDDDDTLLVPTDTGMDSDAAEALYWWEAYLNRYNNDWTDSNKDRINFYDERVVETRLPVKKNDDDIIDSIIDRLNTSREDGIQFRLDPEQQTSLLKLLKNRYERKSTVYELTDRDACPVAYMDIADCYPAKDVRDKIDQLVKKEADTTQIRSELTEKFRAKEISLEHIILPHIQ